jgi:hypothetical protein
VVELLATALRGGQKMARSALATAVAPVGTVFYLNRTIPLAERFVAETVPTVQKPLNFQRPIFGQIA